VVEEGEDCEDASVVFFVCAEAELGEDAGDAPARPESADLSVG